MTRAHVGTRLIDRLLSGADADEVYEAFVAWSHEQGLSLYFY